LEAAVSDIIPGWAVEVTGDDFDIQDAMVVFAPGYRLTIQPFKHEGNTIYLLRNTGWSEQSSPREITADAEQIVRELNGALLIAHGDSKPLSAGRILRWNADGNLMRFLITGSANITLDPCRCRSHATSSNPIEPPQPLAQAWLDRANDSDLMSEMLATLGRATDWFDLFKAIELAQSVLKDDFEKLGRAREKLWNSARRSANFRRHSKAKQEPMLEPDLTFDQAKARVVADIRYLLVS
jgi:hypothetical protein